MSTTSRDAQPSSDALGRGFTEACKFYQHWVMMRYYTFTACALISGVLLGLFFNAQVGDVGKFWARRGGILIAAVCVFQDALFAHQLLRYQRCINNLSEKLALANFGQGVARIWLSTMLGISIYLAIIMAWSSIPVP